MRFNRYTRTVRVPADSALDVMMPREDRAFRELTVWAIPSTGRTNGDRTLGALVNVTGVTVLRVSETTVTGTATGTLSFTIRPRALQWQAPGSPAPGPAVGLPSATTGSLLVRLQGGDGSYVDVDVDLSLLPGADASDVTAVTLVVAAAQVRSFTTQIFFGQTAQGAAAARVNDEAYLAYDPGDAVRIWPPNEPSSNSPQKGTTNQARGFPVTCRVINTDIANDLDITIEFTSMTIDQG